MTTLEVEEELTDLQIEIEGKKSERKNLLHMVATNQAVDGDISESLTEIRDKIAELEADSFKARAKISNERSLSANPKRVAAYAKSLQTYLRKKNIELTKEILREVIVQVRIRPGEEKDTTTVIIRYRIPMPPRNGRRTRTWRNYSSGRISALWNTPFRWPSACARRRRTRWWRGLPQDRSGKQKFSKTCRIPSRPA